MLGAILVMSGPTVVGPLLSFIRPTERLQHVLSWEGSLIDPVGGILGAVVFHAVIATTRRGPAYQLGQFLLGIGVGLAGGVVGTALLWFLLRKLRLGEVLGTTAQLARERIKQAGLELAPGDCWSAATGRGAQLEGVTAVLLLTAEDDFNALGSTVLESTVEGPVYRLGARQPSHGVVAPYTGGEILFDSKLTRYEVSRRYADGARICTQPADGGAAADGNLLFLVRADGQLAPVTRHGPPEPQAGDTMVLLGTAACGS